MAEKSVSRDRLRSDLEDYLRDLVKAGQFFIDGETYHAGEKLHLTVRCTGTDRGVCLNIQIFSPDDAFLRPQVAIILGSTSDRPVAEKVEQTLRELGIGHETVVLSAHRTPGDVVAYVENAHHRGIRLFICIAGLAAHLPGVVAAHTGLPVIGVPVASGALRGVDAALAIVQMPPGVPVAAVGIDAGRNAALLAARILQLENPAAAQALQMYQQRQRQAVLENTPWLQTGLQEALAETHLDQLPLLKRGKVRDIYDLGDHLLIVATDRISVFDVVLPTPIPGKGRILTAISSFWFWKMQHVVPNHLVSTRLSDVPESLSETHPYLQGRIMLVRKLQVFPVECIVRGYLSGSGWKQYKETGRIQDVPLPSGLRESDRLPEPVFTPTTKAEAGHDQPLTFDQVVERIGPEAAEQVRAYSLEIYRQAAAYAEEHGIIIADTKFEFGTDDNGQIYLVDELLTPDSSRFWPREAYTPGQPQPSFDKQYVRDYTVSLGWNKEPPGPALPPEVVKKTVEKYLEAYRRLVPV